MKVAEYYSLIGETPNTYELFDSRDKKKFEVSKKGLSLAMKKKMMGIKKYADGGEVENEQPANDPFTGLMSPTPPAMMTPAAAPVAYVPTPVPTPVPVSVPQMSTETNVGAAPGRMPAGASGSWTPDEGVGQKAPVKPEELQFLGEEKPTQQQAPSMQQQGVVPAVMDPVAMQMKAQDSIFNAEAQKSKLLEQQYANQESSLQEMKTQFESMIAQRNKRSDELFNEIRNTQINPNRYMQRMSTGGKIMSAIGIVLGGVAQGLLRSNSNPGMDVINKAIDQDIEAQKMAGESANNLYNNYLKQTQNEISAYQMAKQDLLTITAAQASKIAAQMGTPQAAAQRDLMKANIAAEIQKANKSMMGNQLSSYATTRGLPPEMIPMLPPDQQKRMVKLPNGMFADAGTEQRASRYSEFDTQKESVLAEIEDMKNLIKSTGTFELLGDEESDIQAGLDMIATNTAKLLDPDSAAKKEEVELWTRALPKPGSLMTSNDTAIKMLDNFKRRMLKRSELEWEKIPAYSATKNQKQRFDNQVAPFETKRK